MAGGPVEAERRTPVMDQQRYVAGRPDRLHPCVEMPAVVGEDVAAGAGSLSESPIPMRSGARHRPDPSRWGVEVGHAHVRQHDVRGEPTGLLDGFSSCRGFADDLDGRVVVEKLDEPGSHQVVVVSDPFHRRWLG